MKAIREIGSVWDWLKSHATALSALATTILVLWQLNDIVAEQEDSKRRDDLILMLVAIELSAEQNARLRNLEKAENVDLRRNKAIMKKLNIELADD